MNKLLELSMHTKPILVRLSTDSGMLSFHYGLE